VAGTTAHYTVTFQNPLPATAATSLTITDNLPPGFVYKAGTFAPVAS